MARVDYFAIEEELASILRAGFSEAVVSVEAEMLFSPEQTPWIGIYLDRREAPRQLQRIAAGAVTVFRLTFTLWVWCYSLDKVTAIQARDDAVGKLEILLMQNRTINDMVNMSWIEGGRLPSGRVQSNAPVASQTDFLSGGEIILIAEVESTI